MPERKDAIRDFIFSLCLNKTSTYITRKAVGIPCILFYLQLPRVVFKSKDLESLKMSFSLMVTAKD